jgi:predicted ATPase
VLGLDRTLEDILLYLFTLLGIEEPPSPLQQMDPQIRRRRTFESLKKLFLRESLTQPLILIFEDLHWIDSETQGLLDVLSEGVASARVLLLVNYRPEYRHEWGSKTYYTQLRLAPFGKEEAEELLTALLGKDSGLKRLQPLILEKTEGTPFFMEEVVQTLAEEGVLRGERGRYRVEHVPTALHISPTVQGVLAARIDRLAPDEKALLQQLAVIGREFPVSLLRQVIAQSEEALYRLLASLQRKEFLYEQPAFPEVAYLFKHALTQEVAYGTVLHDRRKALHERTAQALETLSRDNLDEHYSELAYHYTRSGNTVKAVEYLSLAGQQAVRRSANVEAITQFSAALELLKLLPDTSGRIQQELDLQVALGPALIATKGWAAPEVEKAYIRAQDLCQQVGETAQLFPVLWGLWVFYYVREEFRKAYELGERLLTLAQRAQDSALLLEAHMTLGVILHPLGEFISARTHLQQSIAFYDPQRHRAQAFLYGGTDPGMRGLAQIAWTLWMLGYPDQALKKMRAAVTLAQEISQPHSLAFALCFATELHQFRRDRQAAQEQAEANVVLSTEHGFPFWLARGTITLGWALAEQGQGEEGIAQMRQGLAGYQATGAKLWRSYLFAVLAEAYGKVGQPTEGLAVIAEALNWTQGNEGRYCEAELYRLRGELTLQTKASGPRATGKEAEACFRKAIDIARSQQAKSWELRAATSLARLWQQQGKQQEAQELLSEIYGWFTEGFDTKDLQEAKALLEELS